LSAVAVSLRHFFDGMVNQQKIIVAELVCSHFRQAVDKGNNLNILFSIKLLMNEESEIVVARSAFIC
jgi:hypothetical protein